MSQSSPVTETLRPCPFCGASPHRGRTKLQRDQLHGHLIFNYRIWCPHDCASKKAPSEELALSAWNTRADGVAQDPLVQKIEAEARRYAEMYPQSSDGRNTFVIFADWVAALALSSTDGNRK